MTTATKSFTVVISGPDATAGSMLILWKRRGTSVPTRLEMMMATRRETPTQPEIRRAVPTAYPLKRAM